MFAWPGGLDISDKLVIEGTGEEAVESADGEEEFEVVKFYVDWSGPAEVRLK